MAAAPLKKDVVALLEQELVPTGMDVLSEGKEGYEGSIKRWSDHCEKRAAAVLLPKTATQIPPILSRIREHAIPFVVRGGGHSTSGSSAIGPEGVVIDLSRMRGVTVDAAARTITAEGGTTWEDVDVAAAEHGLATVGGTVNHTGVGGLTLGGGYGYLSGRYGLTIDNLLAVTLVTPSGDLVTASATQEPDLFWAVRGAGQNFGIVTSFTFAAFPQPDPVWAGTLIFTPDKLAQIVAFANAFHDRTDGDQAMLLGFSFAPPGSPAPPKTPVVLAQLFHNGPKEHGEAFFEDLRALAPMLDTTAEIPYAKLNGLLNDAAGFGGRKQFSGGAFRMPLQMALVQSVFDEFVGFVQKHDDLDGGSLMLWEMVPYNKVVEVPNRATAFSNRGEYYNIATCFKWFDPELDPTVRSFGRDLIARVSKTLSAGVLPDGEVPDKAKEGGVGVYANYAETDVPAEDIYGANAERLRELKARYDPEGLFSRGLRLVSRPVVVVN